MRIGSCQSPGWLLTYIAASIFACTVGGNAATAAGVIEEIALPEGVSAPYSIAVDPAGRVWFAEKIGKALTVFDPRTNRFESFALPSGWGDVGPAVIAIGPRGRIWFTLRRWAGSDDETNVLGEFAPANASFARHVLTGPGLRNGTESSRPAIVPGDLIVDRQGAVWFLAPDLDALYRFDPATAKLHGYPIPTAHGFPRGLSIDGQGVVWFVETNANKIGKFDPRTASFSEYTIPTAFANPAKSAVDGKGRVWFVEMSANRIGVFYPDLERFDEALIPTPRSLPGALTADGDGNIWFLEYRTNKVGLFDPVAGTFREFDIPTYGSEPGDLAIDTERGLLWFSEAGTEAKRLGMLSLAKAAAAADGNAAQAPDTEGDAVFGPASAAIGSAALLLAAVLVLFFIRSRKRPVA